MPRLPVFLFVAALALLVAAIAAACDGDGGLSLEEYFSEMQAISDDVNAGRDALSREFQAVSLLEGLAMVASEARDRLGGIDPPAEAEDAHNELALAFAAVEAVCQGAADGAAEVESRSEITELLSACKSVEASSQFRVPCRALELLADDNGIQVNLRC